MGSIASMQLEETSTNDHRKYITISDYNKTARRPSSHPGPLVAIETAWQRVQNAHSLTHSHGRLMVEQGGGDRVVDIEMDTMQYQQPPNIASSWVTSSHG